MEDLCLLKKSGLFNSIIHYVQRGGAVVGICGGYQMMGNSLYDPLMVESMAIPRFPLYFIFYYKDLVLWKALKMQHPS
jgi:cobyric acid synthase